jgi:hypothetical protein
MASKRKRVVISFAEKLAAVKQVEEGCLLKTVAANYGVGISTVSDWVKSKPKFLEQAVKNSDRKTLKKSDFEKVNEALFMWFTQQREKGMPLTGPLLQEKAKMLAELLGDEGRDFCASSGWLDRFKKRYGIRQLNLCGEKLSADPDAVDVFKTMFADYTEGYSKDQIYNADETGVNFKMLPKKSLASATETSAPGHKMKKERITVLFASNASGTHRLPPMCIGKSMKPRALKNIAPNALPVFYRAQKSAWMSSDLFEEWFLKQFVPQVEKFLAEKGLPKKAILLIDNAPTHPSELKSGDIVVRFLPPNVTSLIQPLDQGVIETFKRHYRGLLLRTILQDCGTQSKTINDALKAVNMKHVIYWCAQAWAKIKDETLQRCWRKIYDGLDEEETESFENLTEMVQSIPGCEDCNENDVDEWVAADDSEELSDEDIVEAVLQPADNTTEVKADDVDDGIGKVTPDDGFNALEVSQTLPNGPDESNKNFIKFIF